MAGRRSASSGGSFITKRPPGGDVRRARPSPLRHVRPHRRRSTQARRRPARRCRHRRRPAEQCDATVVLIAQDRRHGTLRSPPPNVYRAGGASYRSERSLSTRTVPRRANAQSARRANPPGRMTGALRPHAHVVTRDVSRPQQATVQDRTPHAIRIRAVDPPQASAGATRNGPAGARLPLGSADGRAADLGHSHRGVRDRSNAGHRSWGSGPSCDGWVGCRGGYGC